MLKEGYAIDAFITMNEEERISLAAALTMSLRVLRGVNELNEFC